MKSVKFLFLWVVGFLLSVPLGANNVKVIGDVRVIPSKISGKMAPFDVVVEWDNSWKDEFNYDAVYVFLKYKLNEADEVWNHVYLADEVALSAVGSREVYNYQLVNSKGTANLNEGILISRKEVGYGKSSVKLSLKWDITCGERALTYTDFNTGKVFLSAMAIEMVYVPQGAFRAGDSQRGKHFHHKYMDIPEKWDIVSEEYNIQTKENYINPSYPPQFAANRMNDVDRTKPTNAWVGDKTANQFWRIDFGMKNGQPTGEKKTVRYIAIEGIPGYVPESWTLYGMNTEGGGDRVALLTGTAADWSTDAHRVYPATKALAIKDYYPYRYYELHINSLGSANGPAIKTIAMCEKDLSSVYDNSVLITGSQLVLTEQSGMGMNALCTEEVDMKTGLVTTVYPTGYPGFFAMKYEISQEQYVAFLNKLELSQQSTRTVGEKLVSLQEGQYIFGDDPAQPSFRNGIILAKRSGITDPVIFANNLKPEDGGYNLDGDGQTLACNYLSPADMLAYADWTGLRPLSELEYEKMCRRPFPAIPLRGEYAWNTSMITNPAALTEGTQGTRRETVQAGNINLKGTLGGPVRCGAFATESSDQESAGASYWGIMELSGNVAEIYYNLNIEGRKFSGIPRGSHGNGKILRKTGDSDMAAGIWPVNGDAFGLRGGSFKSEEAAVQTSDRSEAIGVYVTGKINQRRADAGFRLGCTMQATTLPMPLTLENGLIANTADAADTIWTGHDYLIQGEIPTGLEGSYTIAWFFSGDGGATWDLMEEENGKDLRLTNLRNINVGNDVLKEYHYRCEIYSEGADVRSAQVILRVINSTVEITAANIDMGTANSFGTITLHSFLPMEPKWSFKDQPDQPVLESVNPGKDFEHTPVYNDFEYNGEVVSGRQPLVFHYYYYDTHLSPLTDTVWVEVPVVDKDKQGICGYPILDSRGEKPIWYNTVKVGQQCWMAENMNYAVSGSRCYGDDPNNCARFGRLYNWRQAMAAPAAPDWAGEDQVQGICPDGWHVPNNTEWTTLFNDLNKSGKNMKSFYWGNNADAAGFGALPGGGYFYAYLPGYATYAGINSRTTEYYDANSRAWWWTSTNNIRGWSTTSNSGSEWNSIMMPFYVMLENNDTFQQNTDVPWSTYPALNSIFSAGDYRHLHNTRNSNGINDGHNATVRDRVREQFYFSVRCMRNTLLRPEE